MSRLYIENKFQIQQHTNEWTYRYPTTKQMIEYALEYLEGAGLTHTTQTKQGNRAFVLNPKSDDVPISIGDWLKDTGRIILVLEKTRLGARVTRLAAEGIRQEFHF